MKKIKIALYQAPLKGFIKKPVLRRLQKEKPDFLVLPEYFFSRFNIKKLSEQYLDETSHFNTLKNLSLQLFDTVIVGGSMIVKREENFYNTAMVFYQGKVLGTYHKQNLFGKEHGDITAGSQSLVFEAKGVKFSVLICADVFLDSIFEELKALKTQLVMIPTFSPYKEETIQDKIARDYEIFVNRANFLSCPVVKVCGINTKGLLYPIQGRSLIALPKRILWRAPFNLEEKEILKVSNLIL